MATRYPLGCALGLMLSGVALQALADPPAAPASNNNGLMTFPNVSVVNAPIDAAKQAAQGATAASGMKAYMQNGQLTEATTENAAELSKAATPRTAIAGKTAASTSSASTNARIVRLPQGMMIETNEGAMMFSVAHKDANGKVTQQCVTGEDSATHTLHSPAAPAAVKQESANDR